MAALLKEIELAAIFFPSVKAKGVTIETIYFGGGTPSLCSGDEITAILEKLATTFVVSPTAEITLEANPDDLTNEKLLEWKLGGVNRLSIGVQSFFEEDLQWMNRAHNSLQATRGLELATSHFNNITIDLIYGTPTLSDEKWKKNVDQAVGMGIPHLSCYALTVEPKTPLQKLIREQKLADVDPGKQSSQFLLLMDWLQAAGYEHYEISNFARPGFRSRHNSSYWQGKSYYGFGPSAHSFDGRSRWWNISNNPAYIRSIEKDVIPFEKEDLTPVQKLNERIMISLRTAEGLNLQAMAREMTGFTEERLFRIKNTLLKDSNKYLRSGLMEQDGDWLRLTKQGKLLADGIAADLFAVPD